MPTNSRRRHFVRRESNVRPIFGTVLAVVMQKDRLRVREAAGVNFVVLKAGEEFSEALKKNKKLAPALTKIMRVIILRSRTQPNLFRMSEPQVNQIRNWAEKFAANRVCIAYDYANFRSLLAQVSGNIKVSFSPADEPVRLSHGHAALAPPPKYRVPTRRRKVKIAVAA